MAKKNAKPKRPPKPYQPEPPPPKPENKAKKAAQGGPADPKRAGYTDEDDATDEQGITRQDQGESDKGFTISAPSHGHL